MHHLGVRHPLPNPSARTRCDCDFVVASLAKPGFSSLPEGWELGPVPPTTFTPTPTTMPGSVLRIHAGMALPRSSAPNFQSLFGSEIESDVKLTYKKEFIFAHAKILGAR
jgi:hypothetical protein